MKKIFAKNFALSTACFALAFCFATTASGAELHSALTTHVPEAVARGTAKLVGHLPADRRLSLAIALPLQNEPELKALLQRIYDPQNSEYHHYLSVEEFTDRFGPAESDYAAVQRFARASGLTIVDSAANRMVLDVEGTAENIENAFHVKLGVYQHPTENRTFYAPDREPALDLGLKVLHISGLDDFALPHTKLAHNVHSGGTQGTGSGPNGAFIGSDLRAAYYGAGPLTGAGQSVGLFEYGGYNLADVQTYFKNVNESFTVPVSGVSLNGVAVNCPKCEDSEQVLDIEIAASMAPGLSQIQVYVGSSDVSIFNQMAADNSSKQLSCSWGWKDDESSLDPIFEEMMAQGQSVFIATGDDGSSTSGSVVWPSDDPYITAVGGTDLVTSGAGGAWASETGWRYSAGMPSKNGVPIPSYQQAAGVINSSNGGSTTLRNIPDVAAEANTNQYSCWDGGCSTGNGGTSYAAPQWAALTAMANQQAAANGEKPLGFLNPTIYSIGTGSSYKTNFHDITSGTNGKYNDVVGYDLVTGWGSPIGVSLIDTLAPVK